MKTGLTALGLWVSLISKISANKDVITLNTNGEAWIQEATATLVVPKLPGEITGDIALWSAIMMNDFSGDFLQGVTQSSPASLGYCNIDDEWCNFAYTLKGSNPTVGKAVVAKPGSKVQTHCKGQHGTTFYISIECASGTCDDAPAHSWEDVSIVLNQADQSFGHSGDWQFGAQGGAMSTSDDGKTWSFSKLSVPETPIAHEA
ncbi:hypothetical protein KC318_g2230 [Hortaea werneckii]|nr:hypothetical protein KC334_g2348 [Hortaea werneckii]KAI7021934.1 hypothetical protein KC355_g2227 [Hortaea werneckii]KAI7673462.1 hypothetical protein KC318_g2230 [Hortaea werneckii]